MSESSTINLLIADGSSSNVEHILKTLGGDNYKVESTQTDQVKEIHDAVNYQPLDIILLRLGEGLPGLAEVRSMVVESGEDIPIIVILDDEQRQQRKPSGLLEEGADNYFYLDDADHLVATVRKELKHLQDRKTLQSFEVRFHESESRSQALLGNIQEAIAYIHEGVHAYANPAYLRLFGYKKAADLAAIQMAHMLAPGYRDALKSVMRRSIRSGKAIEPVELVGVRSNGENFPILLECAPTRMNDEPCTQIIVRDATPNKTAQDQQFEDLIKYDGSTGLYSKRFFMEALEIDHSGTVLYILLGDYATIRHNIGFEAVDQFTVEAAGLFKDMLAPQDIAAHFASGVFTVYVPPKSPTDPIELAGQILGVISKHGFQLGGKLFTTNCSIGACKSGAGEETAIQILAHADRACENARKKGGSQVEVYHIPSEESQRNINKQDENQINLIRDALTKARLSLKYQPIVSFEQSNQARYKVYLELRDANGNVQAMDKLGAVAVRYKLMGALDKWTIIRGLTALGELQKTGGKLPQLFIRISRNSLKKEDFFEWLSHRIRESRLPGHHLVFEVREDNAENTFEESKQLRARLRELGCEFALSHFGGKSHSDLLLRDLMPDYIKLDGNLIERLAKAKDQKSRESMAELVEKAKKMNTQVVAAGVSTAPQMASIWQFGVTLVQGNMVAEASAGLDFDFQQFAG